MGLFWGHGLGALSAERGVPDSTSKRSTTDSWSNIILPADRERENRYFRGMCEGDVEQKSDRDRSPQYQRLFQQNISCPQRGRQVETCHRLKCSEQVYRHKKVQNGDSKLGTEGYQAKPVYDFNRSERCLLSGTHTPKIKTSTEILLDGKCLPVQSPSIRPEHSSIYFYENNGNNIHKSPSPRFTSTYVPGRLVNQRELSPENTTVHSADSRLVPGIGLNSESREIRPNPLSEENISGSSNRLQNYESFPCSKEGRKISVYSQEIHTEPTTTSHPMASNSGTHGFIRKTDTNGQNKIQIHSIQPQRGMVNEGELKENESQNSSSNNGGSELVVDRGKLDFRLQPGRSDSRFSHLLGCFQEGLGRPSLGHAGFRHMASSPVKRTYKQLGAQSPLAGTPGVCAIPEGIDCHGVYGQHHSDFIYSEAGRDQVQIPLQSISRDLVLGNRQQDQPIDLSYPRQKQCSSGYVEQKEGSDSNRMVTPSRGMHTNMGDLGSSGSGFIRNQTQPQASALRFPFARSSSLDDRCSSTQLGGVDSICLSPNITNPVSDQQDHARGNNNIPHSSQLAEPRVVPRPVKLASRFSSGTTAVGKTTKTTSIKQVQLQLKGSQASRLEALRNSLKKKGFSKRVAKRISMPIKSSSSKLYEAKWKKYTAWCNRRKLDPIKTSVPNIASFFNYLFEEEKLSPVTIKGYRAMLSQVLSQKGINITEDKDIRALFQSFDREKPKLTKRLPQWDLSLVLKYLSKSPFEPLDRASLLHLTLKTVFLTTLASAGRISEIQALLYSFSHKEDWSQITLSYDEEFIAKTERPGDPSTKYKPVDIPGMHQLFHESETEDRSLCPVRALRMYRKRTENFRVNSKRLFLSINEPHGSVTKGTISSWIKKVILESHKNASENDVKLLKVTAHEVRAVATSLVFTTSHSLESVKHAAQWRTDGTFQRHYLREFSFHHLNQIKSLGLIIAGRNIISLPSSSHQ